MSKKVKGDPNAAVFDEETSRPVQQEAQEVDVDDEELDNVFKGFPQNEACIELYRTTDKGGKPAFVEDIMPADFSFGYVCRLYGGGVYIAKGKYKDGTVAKRSFVIEGPSYPIKRKQPIEVNEPRGPERVEREAPIQVLTDKGGQPDVMATMLALMQTMVKESRTSEMEMLEKMKIYKDLFGHQEKPAAPIDQAIAMIKQGIELGSSSNAGDGGGIPWLMIVDKLKDPIMELATTLRVAVSPRPTVVNPGPVSVQAQPAQPAQPTQPAQAAPVEENPQNMEMILTGALRQVLPMLVTGAAQKAEEGFYVDFMLDQMPRQYYNIAKTWLERPDCLQNLNAMNPGVGRYQGWFETLRAQLIQAITAELDGDVGTIQPEPTANPTTGSATDI